MERNKRRRRKKWEKGENANSRCFMNRKWNLNKVVAYKNMHACIGMCACALCGQVYRNAVSVETQVD